MLKKRSLSGKIYVPLLAGTSKMGHIVGPNQTGHWSNQDLVNSVTSNNSDRGLKRKRTGFLNEPSDIPVFQEPLNHSHKQQWAPQHHYNQRGQRPQLIDPHPFPNPQHHLSSAPRLNLSSPGIMNPESPIPTSKPPWRPSLPFQKHVRSPFDMLNSTNQPFDGSETQVPKLRNQQFQPQISLPQEARLAVLGFNPSHLAARPMIRGNSTPMFSKHTTSQQ